MLDPAIIHDLQRAMIPPSLPPLAMVREWVSPHTEQQQAVVRAMVAAGSISMANYRAEIDRQLSKLDVLMSAGLSDDGWAVIDAAIPDMEKSADDRAREIERDHARYEKNMARLMKLDPQIARMRKDALKTIHGWQRESLETILDVALHLRALRAKHDGQSKVIGTFDNPGDLTAFLEAAIAA